VKKRLLTKQIIAMGILYLAAQAGVETARADLVNGDFGDGFSGWTAKTDDEWNQSTFDPTGDSRYNINGNSATISLDGYDWHNSLYQEFIIGAGAEYLNFDYLWTPSNEQLDSVQAGLWFDDDADGVYDSFIDLFQGATNTEVLANTSISVDISAYQSKATKLEFLLSDYDWNLDDTFTFGNIHITSASAPVPEPSTVLLMGIGLAGLAGVRRKQKQ